MSSGYGSSSSSYSSSSSSYSSSYSTSSGCTSNSACSSDEYCDLAQNCFDCSFVRENYYCDAYSGDCDHCYYNDPYADDDESPIGIIGGIVCGVLITCAGFIWCIYTVQQNNNTAIVQAQLAQQQAQPQMMMQAQPQMMQPQMQVQVQAQKGFGA